LSASAQEYAGPDSPSIGDPCPQCGSIVEIREIEQEREMARLLPERAPPVGPIIRFNFGEGSDHKPHVGAIGSKPMRDYLTERHYEVTIRFDDGRFGFIELPVASGLKVGDRIRLRQGRIEPDDSDLP
jgi:hypothetical protein